MRFLRLLPLTIALILVTACGYKGPVQPLESPLPGPVKSLEVRQKGSGLLVSWQLPTNNQDGSALQKPPVLDLFRMTYDPLEECPECFDRSEFLVRIEPDLPQPARLVDKGYQYLDRDVEVGIGYQYKLVPLSPAAEQGQPLVLRQEFRPPLPAPADFRAQSRDRSVLLSWQAVDLPDGFELLGYRIYRRTETEKISPFPLNPEPVQNISYEDFNLENGRRYHYQVRALGRLEEQTIEGLASEELSAVPQPNQ